MTFEKWRAVARANQRPEHMARAQEEPTAESASVVEANQLPKRIPRALWEPIGVRASALEANPRSRKPFVALAIGFNTYWSILVISIINECFIKFPAFCAIKLISPGFLFFLANRTSQHSRKHDMLTKTADSRKHYLLKMNCVST